MLKRAIVIDKMERAATKQALRVYIGERAD